MFCKHKDIEFIGNIHGDLIDIVSLKHLYRSAYYCQKCRKIIYKEELNREAFDNHLPTYNDYLKSVR